MAILVIRMYAIKIIVKESRQLMKKNGVDLTRQSFLENLIGWTLKALLFITAISKLGVTTTSFTTIIRAAGLAVGLALQGSLSNYTVRPWIKLRIIGKCILIVERIQKLP